MPELPEVETVARQLAPLASGQVLKRLEVKDELLKLTRRDVKPLEEARLTRVYRLGKQVALELKPAKSAESVSALVHLRMTGRLIWSAGDSRPEAQAGREPRARFVLEGGSIYFFDVRRFGTISIAADLAPHCPWRVDPTVDSFTVKLLTELLGSAKQEIKAFLLRQDRIVGIGNIYASEILAVSGIHPQRGADSLDPLEIRRLHKATRSVLAAAIKHCGTTFSDFQQSSGEIGGYQHYLKVYQRAGQPCAACKSPIERIVQQQRSTFFCPQCQSLPLD